MSDDAYTPDQPTQPSEAVAALARLVGSWTVTGEAQGTVRYEWMPGRFFLLQHVQLTEYGQQTTGLEVIGHLRPFSRPARRSPRVSTIRPATPWTTSTNWSGRR